MLTGYATDDATKAYADSRWADNPKLSPDGWRLLDGLTVAKIGMGTYRMAGAPAERAALRAAWASGLNLVDTAPLYMGGLAEEMIGQELAAAVDNGALTREQVVLVTKVGFGAPEVPGAVALDDGTAYSLHPDFIRGSVAESAARLGVETLDVVLLHNPETLLQLAAQSKTGTLEARRAALDSILVSAFTALEDLAREGKVVRYGVSSNTLGTPPHFDDHLDLARLAAAADAAAQAAWGRRKRSLFRVIELPMNLLELGPLRHDNTTAKTFAGDEAVPVLELAARRHMGVLVNRPLNAFAANGEAYRLASAPAEAPSVATAVAAMADAERSIEAAFGGWPALDGEPLLRVGLEGAALVEQVSHSIHADQVLETFFYPRCGLVVDFLDEAGPAHKVPAATLKKLRAGYLAAFKGYLAAVRGLARQKDAERLAPLEKALRPRLPDRWASAPLQRVALNAVASVPGVTSVLCGCRTDAYVADARAVLERGDFVDVAAILGATTP